jgi:hypothetical protein
MGVFDWLEDQNNLTRACWDTSIQAVMGITDFLAGSLPGPACH